MPVGIGDVSEWIAWSKFAASQQTSTCGLGLVHRRIDVLRPNETEPEMRDAAHWTATRGRMLKGQDIMRTWTLHLH